MSHKKTDANLSSRFLKAINHSNSGYLYWLNSAASSVL